MSSGHGPYIGYFSFKGTMFTPRYALVAVPFAAVSLLISSPILNESKRRFYEDENDVVPVPGTVTPSSGTELEMLGPNRLVDGISVRSTKSLESFFGSARGVVVDAFNCTQNYLNQGYTRYYETERLVADTVSGLHSRHEDLLPNAIYIAVAALSGNIIARQRGALSKVFFPVALGVASFRYFLPQTFSNTAGLVWQLEQRSLPQVAQQQEAAATKAGELVKLLEESTVAGLRRLHEGVQSLRKSVADVTGLNIDEEVSKK